MRKKILTISLFLLISLCISQLGISGNKNEHWQFSAVALDSVLNGCDGEFHDYLKRLFTRNDSIIIHSPLWTGKSFADISVAFSGKDLSPARHHDRGRTLQQQLELLTPAMIEKSWKALESRQSVKSAEQKNQNVVVNYLLHHLIALRFANRAGGENDDGEEDLKFAFIYEAMALGYLVDIFSSAHLLVDYKMLSYFQPFNYKKAHDFFVTKGAFVINSNGDAWQTFGDGLMLWFEPTNRYTLNACLTSLRELLLVFYSAFDQNNLPQCLESFQNILANSSSVKDWLEARSGKEYYVTLKMPSLMSLPMPTTASWSKKLDSIDEHGIHRREHYPQLRDAGLHDPDEEGIDREFLYSKNSIPQWLIFDEFQNHSHPDSAKRIIKENENFASVRYVQQRYYPPSIVGFIFNAGGGASFNNNFKPIFLIGAGFGFVDKLLFLKNVSVDVVYINIFDDKNRHFITTTLGGGIHVDLPAPFNIIKSFRFETGHAWEKDYKFTLSHNKIAAGIELPVLPLGFTYTGLTSRIMVQRIATSSAWYGLYFQIVLH